MLSYKLKNSVIEELKGIRIYDLDRYARQYGEIISFLKEKEIVDNDSIEGSLEIAIIKQARSDFDLMTRKGRHFELYPDHVGKPECLAYALEQEEFTQKEISKIPFDHGETAETFPKKYGKPNLPQVLRNELENPKEPLKYDLSDSHSGCSCCH